MWVFAHRGESAIYPENSRDAIAACDSSEMDGIEVDLYQAGDRFVVFHDRWRMRVLGLQKKVTDLTSEELERIVGRDDKPLPDLAWLLKTAKDKELTLNIELKNIHVSHHQRSDEYLFTGECICVRLVRKIIGSF